MGLGFDFSADSPILFISPTNNKASRQEAARLTDCFTLLGHSHSTQDGYGSGGRWVSLPPIPVQEDRKGAVTPARSVQTVNLLPKGGFLRIAPGAKDGGI